MDAIKIIEEEIARQEITRHVAAGYAIKVLKKILDEFVQPKRQEKFQAEKEFLLADISEVKNILAKIPEDATIYRASFEYRLEEALKELEEITENERLDQKV